MHVQAERLMVAHHLASLRTLRRSILALPGELLVRQKMIGVLMFVAHAFLGQRDKQKQMPRLRNEAGIPGRLVERETECGTDRFARIALPRMQAVSCLANNSHWLHRH